MLMPLIKTDTTAGEQLEKVSEEFTEVIDAVTDEESTERILEECMDLIQATVGFMRKVGTKEEIVQAIWDHHVKMYERDHEMEMESIVFEIK